MNGQYEAGSVKVSWYGVDLSHGWAEDTFLDVVPLGAKVQVDFGADGQATDSKLANRGATITMNFKQTAPVNKDLAKLAAAQDAIGAIIPVAPFTVEDLTGNTTNFIALNARLTEGPSQSFGKAVGEKTWVWVCESYFDTEDPSTFQSKIKEYLNF